MALEGRLLIVVWLLTLTAGLLVTIGLPAAFTVLADTFQLARSVVFER